MNSARWSRRQFLRGSAASAGLLASPWRSLALSSGGASSVEGAISAALAGASTAGVTLSPAATRPIPLLRSTVSRPLRYAVVEGGYRIRNGRERFNRPLYGPAAPHAVLHAGDVPEIRLLWPGATAHLRFAVAGRGMAAPRALTELEDVTTDTHSGRVLYTLRDAALLGRSGELLLEILATDSSPGAHVVLSGQGLPPELALFVGLRLGAAPPLSTPSSPTAELVPGGGHAAVVEDPAACAGVAFQIGPENVTADAPGGQLALAMPSGAAAHVADAAGWNTGWEAISTPPAQAMAGPQVLVVRLAAGSTKGVLAARHVELRLLAPPAAPLTRGDTSSGAQTPAPPRGAPAAGAVRPASAPPSGTAGGSQAGKAAVQPTTPAERLRNRRVELRDTGARVRIRTPDPSLDAALTQLNLAAESLFSVSAQSLISTPADPTPSPGWSAPPGLDALGLHDHVRRHLQHWAALQNTSPLPPGTEPDGPVAAPPDSGTGLARKASMLDSNGAFGAADRDTSLSLLESMVRHLRWTGDLEFAKVLWPAIQRGLDRQYRLFRRDVPDPESHYLLKPNLPVPALALYESYGSLSATDGISYNGAGVTHATARNLFLNREAAVLARLLGQEAIAYDTEADLLDRSLRKLLWQPKRGCYAESLDTLLPQTLTEAPGLWTATRVLDSECVSPREAWQIVAERLAAHIPVPVTGAGLPEPDLTRLTGARAEPAAGEPSAAHAAAATSSGSGPAAKTASGPPPPTPLLLASSTWLGHTGPTAPGAGVACLELAENARMALALFQAGEPDIAFALLQGCILDSTARGLVPGNLHRTSALDPVLGETGVDHPDSFAALSRAVVEGIFGVNPDLLRANLTLRPGFPPTWTGAELHHPDLDLAWSRTDLTERFVITNRLSQPATLTLSLPARATGEPVVLSGGKPVAARFDPNSTPGPRLLVEDLPAAPSWTIEVRWRGKAALAVPARATVLAGDPVPLPRGLAARPTGSEQSEKTASSGDAVPSAAKLDDPQICLLHNTAAEPGPHAVFARVVDGNCGYWLPVPLNIVPTSVTTSTETDFADLGSSGGASTAAASQKFEPLLPAALFDGFLPEILTRSYRAPRSPLCSLGMPEHLLGDSFAPGAPLSISDRALRSAPRSELRAFGVPFTSPRPENAPNCRFFSSWKDDSDGFELSLHGRASALHLLVAAVSPPADAAAQLGLVRVRYADGTEARMTLSVANGLWPIHRDLFLDDFVFAPPRGARPVRRVDLATGETRTVDPANFAGQGLLTPNGSASVLTLPLSPERDLAAFHMEASRYGAVVALLGATLARFA